MKILHICCNLAGSAVFPQMFEAMAAGGIDQEVFVPEKRAGDIGKNTPAGVKTHAELTVKRSDALLFFRKAQRSVPVIRGKVDMGAVDLIHAHTLFTDGSIASRLSRETGVPYCVTLRYSDIEAIWKYEPHLRPMARRILHGAKGIAFLSRESRDKVLRWFAGEARTQMEKKAAIIPNGIRPEWLTGMPKAAPGETVRVGFAGVLTKRKRPLDAVRAVHMAKLAGRRFVLRAAGDGPLRDELTAALGEGDAYLGKIAGMDAMKAFYADVDMLLVPSSAETFGMVYLEAMSQGVPVLYTRAQGFDGQFDEGEVGYSVVCGDIAQQAARIADLCEDYEARSVRCIERSKAYAWPNVTAKWAAFYGRALRG